MKKVSIVVLNWNGWKDTLQCLKSVEKIKVSNFQLSIIVVDNASTNKSVKEIKRYVKKSPLDIAILENEENLGFAGGNNVGIRHAISSGSDYIMILNNDTVVDKNIIKEFLKVVSKNPTIGILSPKIYFAKGFEFHKKRYKRSDLGKVIWSAGGTIDWDNMFGKNRGVDEVDKGQFDKSTIIEFATGACMFLNVEAIKKVGAYDERYFMYFEDVDLCTRMRKKGWEINYVPKAMVWHKVAQSSGIGSDLNDYFITRNRLLFGVYNAPIRTKVALLRESFVLTGMGRKWQIRGAIDFYTRKFGKGSWA
jgi:GT2 family glycosyltransferase